MYRWPCSLVKWQLSFLQQQWRTRIEDEGFQKHEQRSRKTFFYPTTDTI
jgi:hypothetical protein